MNILEHPLLHDVVALAHPVLYGIVTLAALYVAWSGLLRARSLHCDWKHPFPWKKHVFWGSIVLGLWGIGHLSGFAGAMFAWNTTFFEPAHAYTGVLMLPLALVGYFTGRRLDRVKKRRKLLPAIHGINNMILVILALYQLYSGYEMFHMVPWEII